LRIRNRDPFTDVEFSYNFRPTEVWVNFNDRIVQVFNADVTTAERIRKIFNTIPNLTLHSILYEETFFRWLINNVKDHKKKFPPGSSLIEIDDVNVKDAGTYDTVRLKCEDGVKDTFLYEPISEEGERRYFEGVFKINKMIYHAFLHKNGKITFGKSPPGITFDDFKKLIPKIYHDFINLREYWQDELEREESK